MGTGSSVVPGATCQWDESSCSTEPSVLVFYPYICHFYNQIFSLSNYPFLLCEIDMGVLPVGDRRRGACYSSHEL